MQYGIIFVLNAQLFFSSNPVHSAEASIAMEPSYVNIQEDSQNYLVEYKRWKKKTLQARWLIGLLVVICCILIVLLIVTYERGNHDKHSRNCFEQEKATSSSIIKFLHLSDIHYDPFYNKTISNSFFCREQIAKSTAKYLAPYGRIGCDSPMLLLENSLEGIKNITLVEEVNFILLTGRCTYC